jgi:hypothetical protein
VLAAFPEAKAVALPEVVPFAVFPNQLPAVPLVPGALEGGIIHLERHELRPILVGQSDTSPSTVVHIPDLDAVVGAGRCL